MAVGIRTNVARQLPSDGGLRVCQLDLPTDSRAHGPKVSRCALADDAGWVLAAVPGLPADRLVLGRWFCRGIRVSADPLDECRFVLLPMPFLFSQVPH